MNLFDRTSMALRYGAAAGVVIMAAGLAAVYLGLPEAADMMMYGVLILILSPLLGVSVTAVSLVLDRDWAWAGVAGALLACIAAGVLAAWMI